MKFFTDIVAIWVTPVYFCECLFIVLMEVSIGWDNKQICTADSRTYKIKA
ncbi:hypothetical protein XNA1_4840022 [Xenorhabdus nematophila str. Anatoliense]|nr:hypothetical protein XNA1_4840022 [Xenorhabdus nematophila str. Anatoliense]